MRFGKSTKPPVRTDTDTPDDGRDGWTMDEQPRPGSRIGHVSARLPPLFLSRLWDTFTSRGSASQESAFLAVLPDVLLITAAVLLGGLIMATIIYFS